MSQVEFSISSMLKGMVLENDKQAIIQVVHLTTAIFLILIGSILEYSPHTDKVILTICLITGTIKTIAGLLLTNGNDILSDIFTTQNYKYFPIELLFAINDSIKYIEVIYIAKWIDRKNLIIIVGFMFVVLGVTQ